MNLLLHRNFRNCLSQRRQIRRFHKLTSQYQFTTNEPSIQKASEHSDMRLSCSANKKARRPWPPTGTKPTIVCFGSNDSWQRDGLWPGFRSISDFHFYEVPNERLPNAISQEHERKLKAVGFLKFIDAIDKTTPVHIAFFYHSGRHISDELIEEIHYRGIRTVIMSLDDKHQFSYPVDPVTGESHQLRVARQVDLYWSTWKVGTQIVKKTGGNPWYNGEAANPDFYRPLGLKRDLDVVFIGANYGYRGRFVNHLIKRGIPVDCFGYGWPNGLVSSEEMVRLFNRAHVVLGFGGVGHMSEVKHLKGRDFEVPMCGALYLTSYNPELCDFFNIGREILCYSSMEECEELIAWTIMHPQECQIIRNAARQRSLREHTWQARLQSMIEVLRDLYKNPYT
ncbi:MAG: glycosyltransferase [Sedimentisphaerales bacterium]|nr:glycosyltransferase [Sedimentisphaerales bacterium]